MPTYEPLERFLKSLSLPLLSRLRDSDVYLNAVESGLGLFEMDAATSESERTHSGPLPNGWKVRITADRGRPKNHPTAQPPTPACQRGID